MGFSKAFDNMNWNNIHSSIYNKTDKDVERALEKSKINLDDFEALISPAAEKYLELMAIKSMETTRKRFGKIIQLYIPLYLSNECHNLCSYCGFNTANKFERKILTLPELAAESNMIKKMGFEHILLVTGEASNKAGFEYFIKVLDQLNSSFSNISLEVQPLDTKEYSSLINHGLDAVMIYQETYNKDVYSKNHLKGKKRDFKYRLETPDRLGVAEIRKIGIGVLLGLCKDWRTDCLHLAAHLDFLEKKYWKSKYSISFPRLRPYEGSKDFKSVMNEKELVQLICAFRLFNNEVELSLSTRENEHFRDNVLPLGITTMSAGSKTQPGGYSNDKTLLEQFSVNDDRSPFEIAQIIKKTGLEAVWKDTSYI